MGNIEHEEPDNDDDNDDDDDDDDSDDNSDSSDDNSGESDSSDEEELTLTEELRTWANEMNVNHNQLDSLLKILKVRHPELPASARTLLKTPRNIIIEEVSGMKVFKFNLTVALTKHLNR